MAATVKSDNGQVRVVEFTEPVDHTVIINGAQSSFGVSMPGYRPNYAAQFRDPGGSGGHMAVSVQGPAGTWSSVDASVDEDEVCVITTGRWPAVKCVITGGSGSSVIAFQARM